MEKLVHLFGFLYDRSLRHERVKVGSHLIILSGPLIKWLY